MKVGKEVKVAIEVCWFATDAGSVPTVKDATTGVVSVSLIRFPRGAQAKIINIPSKPMAATFLGMLFIRINTRILLVISQTVRHTLPSIGGGSRRQVFMHLMSKDICHIFYLLRN